jgi:hypothetical protein
MLSAQHACDAPHGRSLFFRCSKFKSRPGSFLNSATCLHVRVAGLAPLVDLDTASSIVSCAEWAYIPINLNIYSLSLDTHAPGGSLPDAENAWNPLQWLVRIFCQLFS